MTATQYKADRKRTLHALQVGNVVRVVRIDHTYTGPGTGTVVASAVVVKVLANAVWVAWSEDGKETTDFSRDSGKKIGDRRWINYPVIDPDGPPEGVGYSSEVE